MSSYELKTDANITNAIQFPYIGYITVGSKEHCEAIKTMLEKYNYPAKLIIVKKDVQ